jgi:hypothetical protein
MLYYLSLREVSLAVVEEEENHDDACTLHASSPSPMSIYPPISNPILYYIYILIYIQFIHHHPIYTILQ